MAELNDEKRTRMQELQSKWRFNELSTTESKELNELEDLASLEDEEGYFRTEGS